MKSPPLRPQSAGGKKEGGGASGGRGEGVVWCLFGKKEKENRAKTSVLLTLGKREVESPTSSGKGL